MPNTSIAFIDTNMLLYAASGRPNDAPKTDRLRRLIKEVCMPFGSGAAGILRQHDQPGEVESHTLRSCKMVFGVNVIPRHELRPGHIRIDIGVGSSISDQQLERRNPAGSGSKGLPHRLFRGPVVWSGL